MRNKLSRQDYLFMLQLARRVLKGSIFKQNKDIDNINEVLLETMFNNVYKQTELAFSSLRKYVPHLTENLLLKVVPKSVAFISIIGYELLDQKSNVTKLVDASTVMCLAQIIDHLMDRGDEKMLQAAQYYHDKVSINDAELQARTELIEHMRRISGTLSKDESAIVIEAVMSMLWDGSEVLRLSRQYKNISSTGRSTFLEHNAKKLAGLSIRNVGLRPATYMIYCTYLQADSNLPSINELENSPEVIRATRLGEWAIRLWDDWGDQELDAGQNIYTNSFVINLFLVRNPHLTEAYLQDIVDSCYYKQIWKMIQESSGGINYAIVRILREEFKALKVDLDQGTSFYLQVLERIIEAGFINHAGDENITASQEVLSDYSQAD